MSLRSWLTNWSKAWSTKYLWVGKLYCLMTTWFNLPNWWAVCRRVSTEPFAGTLHIGVYIHLRVLGGRAAGTPGLMSALCFGHHCFVAWAAEGLTHRLTLIHANTKRVHGYSSSHTPLRSIFMSQGRKKTDKPNWHLIAWSETCWY